MYDDKLLVDLYSNNVEKGFRIRSYIFAITLTIRRTWFLELL